MCIMFPEIGSRFLTSSTVVKGLESKVLSWTSRDMKEMQKLVMMIFTISVDQEHITYVAFFLTFYMEQFCPHFMFEESEVDRS